MTDTTYPPSAGFAANAHVDKAKYEEMYAASIADPEAFWAEHGKRVDWIKPFTKVKNTTFQYPDVSIKWFEDGELNVAANCIDRHLATRGDQTAILWEGDNPDDSKAISYAELHDKVCRLANVLQITGCQQRRPGHPVYAHDPRGRLCHAGLRPDRCNPFHRLRWVFTGCAGLSR